MFLCSKNSRPEVYTDVHFRTVYFKRRWQGGFTKPLEQYSLFVDTVRRQIVVDREYGFEKAIKECIENDILKEYLQRKSKEVLNMLIGEYDYDTDIAVQREESFELGLVEGSRQKALETARLMKQANCETVFIEKMTGLSQEEVESLT